MVNSPRICSHNLVPYGFAGNTQPFFQDMGRACDVRNHGRTFIDVIVWGNSTSLFGHRAQVKKGGGWKDGKMVREKSG